MYLYVNGCSHTAGAELDYPQQGQCYEKAWGKHLSDLLNADYENGAMSGASNHRIVRTTYEFLYRFISAKKSSSDLFIVIMWPGIFRTELYLDNAEISGYDDGWLPLVVGNDEQYKKNFPKPLYDYYRGWVTYTDNKHASIDFYNSILNLQHLFDKYKIRYLFLNATNSSALSDFDLFHYFIHINKKRFPNLFNTTQSYTELCAKNNQKISPHSISSGFNSHYDEEAHRWYADYLFDLLHERELL